MLGILMGLDVDQRGSLGGLLEVGRGKIIVGVVAGRHALDM